MNRPTVIIVEKSEEFCQCLKSNRLLRSCELIEVHDRSRAVQFCEQKKPRVVIIVCAQDSTGDGIQLGRQLRAHDGQAMLILVTRYSTEEHAIAALKAGFNDYFKVPAEYPELIETLGRELAAAQSEPRPKKDRNETTGELPIIGGSPEIQRIKACLPKLAATDSTVLITGETGTGKECIARQIHECSPRRNGPLICINCAAVPDSLIESELFGYERGAFTGANTTYAGKLTLADGGSVFFDEIGDMSLCAQAKILRVIENKEVTRLGAKKHASLDIRIIAATNHDLQHLVCEGRFRADLYYRIKVVSIKLPALRERKRDIPPLLEYYLRVFATQFGKAIEGFTDEAFECLLHYDWPGNVRELKNVLEAISINHSSGRIAFIDLPEDLRRSVCVDKTNRLTDRELLVSALLSTNWNKSKAAKKLKWSRMTVYRKMAKYHVHQSTKHRILTEPECPNQRSIKSDTFCTAE